MDQRPTARQTRPKVRPAETSKKPAPRFSRSDGRDDLPVVSGRTPRQVSRRLA